MALSFSDIASRKAEEIERPALPPVGEYRWRITKQPAQTKVGQDDMYEVVTFYVQAQEALDSVDMSEYKGEVNGILNRKAFMLDTTDEAKFEQTLFQLRSFLEKHVRCWDEGMSLAEAMNNSVGQEFVGTIKYRQDKNDTELFYAEIGRTAPIDD